MVVPALVFYGCAGRDDADSTVFILDRHWHKIVGFSPRGAVRMVLLGGEGSGPGEFRTPVDLAVGPEGRLGVLDYELQRLSFFDHRAETISVSRISVINPLRVLLPGNEVWILSSVGPGESNPMATVLDRTGRQLRVIDLPADERPFGASLAAAVDRQQNVLLASARPGIWYVFSGDGVDVRGTPLVPELKPPVVDRAQGMVRVAPMLASTVGIGVAPGGVVLVLYRQYARPFSWEHPPEDPRYRVGVFTQQGGVLGVVDVPENEGVIRYFHVSSVTGNLFVDSDHPYPHVTEYRLVRSSPAW